MNPQIETRALRTSPQSSHHSVEAKNQEARTHIFIHVVFPVPSSDIQMLRKRVQAAHKEVPIRGRRGAKAAMLLWRRVSACLYKVKVVRGLSPKARRTLMSLRDTGSALFVCFDCDSSNEELKREGGVLARKVLFFVAPGLALARNFAARDA